MPASATPKRPRRTFAGLLDYLDHRLGVHQGHGPEYQFFCPFCLDREGSESSQRKLWCNVAKSKAYCFRCGYGSTQWERFFRDLNGGALRIAELAWLKGEITRPDGDVASAVQGILRPTAVEAAGLRPIPCPPEMVRLAPHCRAASPPLALRRAFRYLRERRIAPEKVVEFDLGYCAVGRYTQRLIFPVSQQGRQVYFTNRYCGDHPCKSLNPPSEPDTYRRNLCLVNYDNVVGQPQVAVVEGPFDAMAFPHAVALMGKTISAAQVDLLAALVPRGLQEACVALDADAHADADVVYERLVGRLPRVRVLYLDHGDPDTRRADLPALLRSAATPSLRDRVRHRVRPTHRK
jgi:hypothetical protein